MAKVYVARCIVKRDGKRYEKGSIIEDLTGDEIKRGLAEKWLEAVGSDKPAKAESGKPKGNKKKPTPPEEPTVPPGNELLKKAAELGITVTEEMTADEIQQLITEAEAGAQ